MSTQCHVGHCKNTLGMICTILGMHSDTVPPVIHEYCMKHLCIFTPRIQSSFGRVPVRYFGTVPPDFIRVYHDIVEKNLFLPHSIAFTLDTVPRQLIVPPQTPYGEWELAPNTPRLPYEIYAPFGIKPECRLTGADARLSITEFTEEEREYSDTVCVLEKGHAHMFTKEKHQNGTKPFKDWSWVHFDMCYGDSFFKSLNPQGLFPE